MSALRILHVVGTLRAGGAETLVRELLPRLRMRGLNVAAFSAYDPRLSDDERAALSYDVFIGEKAGRFDLGFPARLVAAIRRYAPDIVHTHTVTGKYWGRACAIAAGVRRIVHTEHSPQPRLAAWEKPLAHVLVRRTDAFVTFSERTAAFVTSREPVPRLEIIPNGIEIVPAPSHAERQRARAALAIAPETILVGVVANLHPQKNQLLAIAALAQLSEAERRRVRLDFFGAGPDYATLEMLAEQAGLAKWVKFWGFRSDARTLMAGFDVLLSVAYVEAAPISLLEAMAAEIPIVGTPHHGTLDLVIDGETGLIAPDWSVDGVVAALRRALADAQWRSRAGAAGRRRLLERFDIETVADRHLGFYQRLCRTAPTRAEGADLPVSLAEASHAPAAPMQNVS